MQEGNREEEEGEGKKAWGQKLNVLLRKAFLKKKKSALAVICFRATI